MPIGRKFERRFAAAVRSWEMEEPDAGEQGDQTEITGRQLRHAVRRADLPAVAEVRRLLREHLRMWGVPALVDTAELLTTELVTNALQHTGDGAVVVVGLDPGASAMRLRVEVHDTVTRRPRLRDGAAEDDQSTSGRGLLLVEVLADAWGVHAMGTGKVVWFELDVATA